MKFNYIHSDNISSLESDYLVVGLTKENSLTEINTLFSDGFANTARQLIESGDFKASFKQLITMIKPEGLKAQRILLVGLGDNKTVNNKQWFELMQGISSTLLKSPALNCHIVLPTMSNTASINQASSDTASQIHQSTYLYSRTLNDSAPKTSNTLSSISLVSSDSQKQNNIETGLQQGDALGQGLTLCRELGNLPGNYCTPTDLQETAEQLAQDSDILQVETLEEADMEALKMGSLLSVSAGSVEPAKLIVLNYNGGNNEAPITLVGKGVTFDTGGISLKSGAKMDEMKYDMCGAASVLGTFKALTVLKPAINVIGLIPATENMPAGNATKPGDVVTSMSGKTIEVLNTDAEGRLILCDALSYAEKFKPKAVIDIATLTGACVVALGHHRSAVYSNDDQLRQDLFDAGEHTQDLAWPMPLDDMYTKQLKSQYADLGNIGGPTAGSVTAACFLAEFAKSYNWAHLDIAGAAWNNPGIKGASGRPVSLLFKYLLNKV